MKLRSAFAQAAVAVATPFGRLCDIFSGVFKHEWRNHSVKKSLVLLTLGFCISLAAFAQQAAKNDFDGKTWWDYVKILADDNMEGRETGSAGLQRAEAYIVEQLKHAGIQPAGSDGYYQQIKFQSREIVEKDSSVALVRDGKVEPLVLGEDTFFSTRVDLAPELQ